MVLFKKPLNEINYDDVIIFCKRGIEENMYLDYKRDFPRPNKKLAKAISSFANTLGGIIIIGVDEDDNSKPKSPFEGINFTKKLEDRILCIILKNINPPIFPEIQIVPAIDDKTFIIIHIEESNETPHRIIDSGNAYIRTGSISQMIDFAAKEQLEWLENRRKKSIEFRKYLKKRCITRKNNLYKSIYNNSNFIEVSIFISPLYPNPDRQFINKEKIAYKFSQVIDDRTPNEQFPYKFDYFYPVQDGVFHTIINKNEKQYSYSEISKFGLFYHCRTLEHINSSRVISLSNFFKILKNTIEIVHKFYNNISFYGHVELSISMKKIKGSQIIPINKNGTFLTFKESHFKLEDDLKWQINFNQIKANDRTFLYKMLHNLFSDISWSFGFKVDEFEMARYMEKL